jgi:CubicO group peptidase (beta-lactamase class C family)
MLIKRDLRHPLATLLLCLLVAANSVCARTRLPDSKPGTVLSDWLAAFNSADLAKIKRFNEIYKQSGSAEDTLGWRADTGGFAVVRVEKSQPTRLIALLQDKRDADERVRATVSLESGSSHSTPKLDFDALEIPRMSQPGALASVVKRVDTLARSGDFSGAVLIARNDIILLRRAWGLADRTTNKPNRPETQFRLGSADKMFTAVAILQLVDSGKLSLDATIDRYLPDFPNRGIRSSVTLRDLLTHQSGLVDIDFSDSEGFTPEKYSVFREQFKTLSDYVAYYGQREPLSKPREKIEYNSFAFVVLGAIIERVSGMSYYDYVDAHVFKPAEMFSTGFLPESQPVPERSNGYTLRDGRWVSNGNTLPYRGTAAGGGYSTVDDLLRFAQALRAGKLLSPKLLSEATHPQISEKWYGYGFITVGDGPLRRYGHGGDSPGMNADIRIFPESGYVLVSLSNIDPPAAYRVFRYYEPRMPISDK